MNTSFMRLILIIFFAFMLCGCGGGGSGPGAPGSDNTGEVGAIVSVFDIAHSSPAGDFGDQWQMDLQQSLCTESTFEAWGDDFAGVTFVAESINLLKPMGDLYLYRYTVEYTAQPSELNLPPIPKLDLTTSTLITEDVGGIGNFLVLDWGTKVDFVESITDGTYNPSGNEPYLYDMKITFYGQDAYGEDFSIIVHRTVMLGNYIFC